MLTEVRAGEGPNQTIATERDEGSNEPRPDTASGAGLREWTASWSRPRRQEARARRLPCLSSLSVCLYLPSPDSRIGSDGSWGESQGESERTRTPLRGRPLRELKTSWVFVGGRSAVCCACVWDSVCLCLVGCLDSDWRHRVNGGGERDGHGGIWECPFPVMTCAALPLTHSPPRGPGREPMLGSGSICGCGTLGSEWYRWTEPERR
jgi:hypothetical protein